MGPHSLVKFQFVVEVEVVSPDPLHPLDRYVAAVRYFPETADFKTESETIDTPKTRAEREREEEASRAKRREAQQARERALRLELEEFSGHAGKPALPVASDAEDGSARKRFREAVLELCISCRRPAAESVYLVERYGGVILKSLEGTRLASICAACVRADHSNVGCKLYRYWGWLPEPQAGSQVAHRAELSLEEWGYWSLVLDGVVHNHDSPLPWSDHDDVRAHIETQASKKT